MTDQVAPLARAEAARRLVALGWSQTRVAEALGVSQAMVSKYQDRTGPDDALVLRMATELVQDIQDDRPRAAASPWCMTLSITGDKPGGSEALDDLLRAEAALRLANPLNIMPQVGLNVARAVGPPAEASDVLAFPARIVAAGDRIVTPAPPTFGASNHLARCLIALRKRDPALLAIANIRGGPDIARAVPDAARIRGAGDRDVLFAKAVAQAVQVPTHIHDEGAVGIEPCLYIAGPDAASVVASILHIAAEVRQ